MGKIFDAIKKSETDRGTAENVLNVIGTVKGKPKSQGEARGSRTDSDTADSARVAVSGTPPRGDSTLTGRDNRPRHRVDKNLVTLNDPSSFESEQFKILRTSLLFPASGKKARTILVTSALPGEGKSFVSANLAVSMAQNINEHVLLIDGDIRKPTLHTTFGFGDVPGLAEHLSEDIPLSSLIQKTSVDKLSLLPSGTPPHNPSELLSSEAMTRLIEETKNRYSDRYIVIDSPPPRFTSETAALARQVDGVIVVINAEATPKAMTEKLVEMIGKEKILGVVMNRFQVRTSRYYGYGKYGSYGRKKG